MLGLRASLAFFTRIPVGGPQPTAAPPGRVLLLGPVAGAVLAVVAALPSVGMTVPAPASAGLLAPVTALAAVAYLTRGLHLDGLADFADGLGADRDARGSVQIMQRSDIGPFGVVTLILILLIDAAALGLLYEADLGWLGLLVALPAGRLAVLALCRPGIPPAPGSRLGSWVAGTVPLRHAAGSMVIVTAAGGAAGWWAAGGPGGAAAAAAAIGTAVLVGLAVGRTSVRRFGGITGDVLGAGIELAQASALVVLALGLAIA